MFKAIVVSERVALSHIKCPCTYHVITVNDFRFMGFELSDLSSANVVAVYVERANAYYVVKDTDGAQPRLITAADFANLLSARSGGRFFIQSNSKDDK